MAKYIHIVLNLPEKDKELPVYGKIVHQGFLSHTSDFPSPNPAMSVFGQNVDALGKAEVAAKNREPGAPALRNAAREKVREDLHHLRDYAQGVVENLTSKVDLNAIQGVVEGVGMGLRKVPSRSKWVFAAMNGSTSGSVDLFAPASRKREPHEWQYSTDQANWMPVPSTLKAKTQVTGLTAGLAHYFRHRLLTKDGHTEWSAPVMLAVK